MTLRRKPPYFCRAKGLDGKFSHLDRALKDGEGVLCADCQKQADETRARFFDAPIIPAQTGEQSIDDRRYNPNNRARPFWPVVV